MTNPSDPTGAKLSITVNVHDTPEDTVLELQTKLNGLSGVKVNVTQPREGNSFNIQDGNSPFNLAGVEVDGSGLQYQPGVSTVYDGGSVREVQVLTITNAATGTFTLSIGDRPTAAIPYNADTATTAGEIQKAINAVRKSTFNPYHYNVDVQVVQGTGAARSWMITFNEPATANVPEMTVDTSDITDANVSASVTTLFEGGAPSNYQNVEKVIAPNANATFIVGDYTSLTQRLVQALPGELAKLLLSKGFSVLEVDTSALSANGHSLVLDFSNVSHELTFTFETKGAKYEVSKFSIAKSAAGTFQLDLGIQESQKLALTAHERQFSIEHCRSCRGPDRHTQNNCPDQYRSQERWHCRCRGDGEEYPGCTRHPELRRFAARGRCHRRQGKAATCTRWSADTDFPVECG